jgi:hypothetical protein
LVAVEFVVDTKIEETQTAVHCSRLDFLQGPGVGGVVVDRHASKLKQQRDQLLNLCGAVDPPRDIDLHCPGGMVSEGRFEDRHVVGIPVGEEAAGLLIVDLDV